MDVGLFDFGDISVAAWVLLAAGLLCALWLCLPYCRRIRRIIRTIRRHTAESVVAAEECVNTENVGARCTDECTEPVSVVVRANDDAATLSTLLPALLSQKYAPGFEVIVVNEGSSEPTQKVVDALRLKNRNLYVTFTPGDAYNLSSKKLAVMLGIKAARNRLVVLTTANVAVDSPLWLSRLTRHFNCPATEVVLGYTAPDGEELRGASLRAFNHGSDAMTWLGAALAGRPYRGTESAIALTTDVFFRNKGFSRSLNLRDGIDDIFISEVVTPENTIVELGRAARATVSHYHPAADIRAERRSHAFTSRFIPSEARRFMLTGPLALVLMTASLCAAGILALPDAGVAALAAIIWLTALCITVATWSGALKALQVPVSPLLVPLHLLTEPLRNLMLRVSAHRHQHRYYTYAG